MNPLLTLETQVLAEGREWTRRRLQTRLQTEADNIGAVCPHSGLVLKDVRLRTITLRTCVGEITIEGAYGFSNHAGCWLFPAREHWRLDPYQQISPELQQRVDYTATQTGSYEKGAAMATRWGSPVSDDLIRNHVQRIGARARERPLPPPAPPQENEAPFSLVIMADAWKARERGPDWGTAPERVEAERVAWHDIKSAVIYRLEHRAENAGGRGMLIEKKVVACPPLTSPVEFGAVVQAQALQCGLARAKEVFFLADGGVWLWGLQKDRFATATALLDFYHGSEHFWQLAHHLHPDDPGAALRFVKPLLHQVRHGEQTSVIAFLEKMLATPPQGTPDPVLHRSIQYFLDHRDHLNYQDAANRGAPVGSGSMESQCSAFQNRFKRTGQFWSRSGFANLMALDVAVRNQTFNQLWN